jgi:iron complex transport system substrate-binding protein
MKNHYTALSILASSALLFYAPVTSARTLTDVTGRTVTVTDRVERAFGSAPPSTLLVYAVAPDKLVALNTPPASAFFAPGTDLLLPRMMKLPVVGGWHGMARGANMEALLALDPQVVIAWNNSFVMEPVLRACERFDLPVVFVDEDRVEDEPASLRLVGLALGEPEAGEKLAADAERRLQAVRDFVATVPERERPSVYYAQGPDGLLTQFASSFHYDPFLVAGARSPFPGEQHSMMGMERVSLEEVILRDPDVIIATDARFVEKALTDPAWAGVSAVKNRRVHLVPYDPVNWLDRPPCFMRILGVQWLASVFYPGRYPADLTAETVSFYRDYLHQEIDIARADALLRHEK